MTGPTPLSRTGRLAIGLMVAMLAIIGNGQMASAHTDFESSSPGDGEVVDGPLAQITLNFTNPARPAGEQFQLLDPSGSLLTPTSVDETDGTSFILSFDPPLVAGTYGLRWEVQAGDAHPIDGSFQFEVTELTPTPTTEVAGAAPTTTVAPAEPAAESDAAITSANESTASGTSLDEFLSADASSDNGAAAGRVGRTLTMLGVIFGVGVLAALVWTIRGNRSELNTQLAWVRLAGCIVFVGGFIEFAALVEGDSSATISNLLSTKHGFATALKMIGGLAVALGFHRRAGQVVAPAHSLSAAFATDLASLDGVAAKRDHEREHRWSPNSSAAVGLIGYTLVLASFWFDGHTVSKGPWAIHSVLNLVHLGAAAVWGGGVFAMTTVAWMRRRRSERVGLAAMVVRFSSLATVSLVMVTVAGLAMTALILDSPNDIFGTPWGRVLLAKMAVVAVAAGLGAYNHFKLRPQLEARPDDPDLAKELRISLLIESAAFFSIVVLTSVLVASAT